MTKKSKGKSRILESVRETAGDLHRLGFIDKRTMRKFDVLCLGSFKCRHCTHGVASDSLIGSNDV